ncbi:hypothetical protein GLYMA_03G016900v4 [Glycine max]|nr:hypothetical protein GLYMA_03G016900v4 [Glycine max]
MPMTKPKPMPEEQKMEYFMQVTEAPLSVAVQKLEKHGGNLNKALEDFYQKDSLRNPSQNEQHRSQKGLTVAEFLEAYPKKTLAELLDESTEGSFSWKKWAAPKILPSHSQKKQKAKSGQLPMSSSSKGPVKQKAIDPLTRPKFPYARIPADKRWEYLERLWRDYADTRDNIHIAVHIPGGGCVQRIFLKTDKLKELFRFLRVIGLGEYLSESYVLATKSPRRCYSIKDGRSTLDEVGLGNGGDLYLEKI